MHRMVIEADRYPAKALRYLTPPSRLAEQDCADAMAMMAKGSVTNNLSH